MKPSPGDKSMALLLRPAGQDGDDQEFLFRLFAGTRAAEFLALGLDQAQMEALLRVQWSAQQRWYETAYAPAQQHIVMYGDARAGRMIVQHGATSKTLVDISLTPEHQGRRIGSRLIGDLIEQCSREKVSLRLQVLKTNPAARLYLRLGFAVTGEDEMYFQMERPVS